MSARALAVLAMLASLGCTSQPIDARSRFVEDGVAKEAPADWAGEAVVIDSAGVTETGGLGFSARKDTTKINASARMVALADTEDKANADRAIEDVKANAYALATAGGVTTVRCGHAPAHGSVAPGQAGCDALDVALPYGTAERPLSVTARSGAGTLVASLAGATVLLFDVRGTGGAIDITTPATPGATITIASETGADVTLRLPRDFAADAITIEAPAEKVDTTQFPGLERGKGFGAPGRGAKLIAVRTSTGRVIFAPQ